jgi:hypothetical protein
MQHGGIQTIHGGFIPEWQPLPMGIRGQIDRGGSQLSLHVGERFAMFGNDPSYLYRGFYELKKQCP